MAESFTTTWPAVEVKTKSGGYAPAAVIGTERRASDGVMLLRVTK